MQNSYDNGYIDMTSPQTVLSCVVTWKPLWKTYHNGCPDMTSQCFLWCSTKNKCQQNKKHNGHTDIASLQCSLVLYQSTFARKITVTLTSLMWFLLNLCLLVYLFEKKALVTMAALTWLLQCIPSNNSYHHYIQAKHLSLWQHWYGFSPVCFLELYQLNLFNKSPVTMAVLIWCVCYQMTFINKAFVSIAAFIYFHPSVKFYMMYMAIVLGCLITLAAYVTP